MALSPIFAAMADGSDRTRTIAFAAQGACDRTPAPHLFRRTGRCPPYSNFRSGGYTGDRRGAPGRFSVLSILTTASRRLAAPATFQRDCFHSDSRVVIGEVG